MKKLFPPLSPGILISQFITGYLTYYLLISQRSTRCSIDTIIQYAHTLPVNQHLMLLGVLPVYIATVIFGMAMVGALAGRWLELQLIRTFRQRKSKISYKSEI